MSSEDCCFLLYFMPYNNLLPMKTLPVLLLIVGMLTWSCKSDESSSRSRPSKRTTATAKPSHPGIKLLAKSPCKTCHNRKVKAIGPSYLAIADRYEATEENIAMLVGKVKKGGKGNWGEVMMNPHPELPESDIEQMVRYILSLKPS